MKLAIVVTGGRDYRDRERVSQEILSRTPTLVIHGACPTGADAIADDVCRAHHIPCMRVPADWREHGKKAGPLRNRQMMDIARIFMWPLGWSVLVLAFPGGRGTTDAKRAAYDAGLAIKEVGS